MSRLALEPDGACRCDVASPRDRRAATATDSGRPEPRSLSTTLKWAPRVLVLERGERFFAIEEAAYSRYLRLLHSHDHVEGADEHPLRSASRTEVE
jgi:hypothetical protein